jgi:hypothetical protein
MNPTPRQIWQRFWGDLNTPEAFPRDWYKALTNQSGHWAWAAAVVCAICGVWALHHGEMPYRLPLWVCVVVVYGVVIEYLRQGWRRRDTINDIYFVALGAAGPLMSLKEATYRPEVWLGLVGGGLGVLMWLGVTVVSLAVYIYPRIAREITEGKS